MIAALNPFGAARGRFTSCIPWTGPTVSKNPLQHDMERYEIAPVGGNGRRGGFKTRCPHGRVGSSPTPGIKFASGAESRSTGATGLPVAVWRKLTSEAWTGVTQTRKGETCRRILVNRHSRGSVLPGDTNPAVLMCAGRQPGAGPHPPRLGFFDDQRETPDGHPGLDDLCVNQTHFHDDDHVHGSEKCLSENRKSSSAKPSCQH